MPRVCRPWTAADDQLVRTLPPAEAARVLGRSRPAIRQRRYVLDAADLRRPWTEAEDRLLMHLPPDQAARYLRRTPAAIQARRRKLGLQVGA